MIFQRTTFFFVLLIVLFSTVPNELLSQTKTPEIDILFAAMRDELNRSLNELELKDFGKPYFIEYGISDVYSFSVSAKFGALQGSGIEHSRSANVQVRLGGYEFDNTNLFSTGSSGFSTGLVLDDDYDSIRRDLWLATDSAYKSAIEQISSKKAFLQNNVVDEKLPDLTREQPISSIQPRQKLVVQSEKWEKLIRELSAIFKKFPDIINSSVTMFARQETSYLLNNEGTTLREPSLLISINIYADTATIDNLSISPSRHIYAKSFEAIPSDEEIKRTVETLAEDLTKLRKAPIFNETYIGPVLFSDKAAVQLFSQLLAPNLADERPPLSSRRAESGVFAERMNRRILPPSINVLDDPTVGEVNGRKVIGNYEFDEQGVPAKPLKLVENGILKTLLSTRVPTKKIPQSNGRSRAGYGRPFISNLIVEPKEGKSFSQLKEELIDSCKAQSLPFGIILREMDSTFFLSGSSLSTPILAYKVYVDDGREELIRNISIDDFQVRELRQILSVGSDQNTMNSVLGNGQRASGSSI